MRIRYICMKTVVKVVFRFWRMLCELKRQESEMVNFHFTWLFLVSSSMGNPQLTSLRSPGFCKCHRLSSTLCLIGAHIHTDTNKHTQTYIRDMKDKWVGCGLLGAVPTQNNKGTNCFHCFSVYHICYSKLFYENTEVEQFLSSAST